MAVASATAILLQLFVNCSEPLPQSVQNASGAMGSTGTTGTTGGIPIDRTASQNTVSVMTARFSETSNLMLTLAPEGRRRHAPHWRSGFYRIARAAQVPLCLGYMDYPSKSVGFSPLIHLSGALKDDMNQIRAFYEGKRGKRPQNAAPIRLRDETTI